MLLTFPDGSSTTMDVLDEDPPRGLVVRYFEVQTTFDIESAAADGRSTVLEVTASDVPKDDVVELAAGWVSVLLNLKAAVNFDCDLRNHNREMTWRAGFVDN